MQQGMQAQNGSLKQNQNRLRTLKMMIDNTDDLFEDSHGAILCETICLPDNAEYSC